MPRQFGQSPLAFALQQALQQGGGLVGSIPALKMQNQEFANQQQGFEQGQLAQMVRLALAQREDQRRQSDFEQGIRDREAANDRSIMDQEAAQVQSRNVGRLADKFGLPGDLFAGAGGTTAQLDDIIRAITAQNKASTPTPTATTERGFTSGQLHNATMKRVGEQRSNLFERADSANAATFGDRAEPISSFAQLAALAQKGIEDKGDSSLFNIQNQIQGLGGLENLLATRDTVRSLFPPGGTTNEPPPNDGSLSPEEYAEFVRKWRAGLIR